MLNLGPSWGAESLTLVGALTVAVAALWKAWTNERKNTELMIRETLRLSSAIEGMTAALDRLRTERCLGFSAHDVGSR